jgi:exodeoxyribonuclease VII large subunit
MNPDDNELIFSVSEFVAVLNQTLEYAYPSVVVSGELANFRVSKGKWLYFDLKDEQATVRFFGTVYQLPGPLEDGMLLKVRAVPRLHPQFGFSLNVQSIRPAGEGSIRRAAALLEAKLAAEGLFDESRKRYLPYPPQTIGLVTSSESAAYADFIKIINARWGGVDIRLIDAQVQGEAAPQQIVQAIEQFNQLAEPLEVIIIIRGGGSAEDLQAFSTEAVTRAVAASRVPTLVAIGHETDISLAELAADKRASTPSNAAEMLVPDRQNILTVLGDSRQQLHYLMQAQLNDAQQFLQQARSALHQHLMLYAAQAQKLLQSQSQLLKALSPQAILQRGYAIVRHGQNIVRSRQELSTGDIVHIQFSDGPIDAEISEK